MSARVTRRLVYTLLLMVALMLVATPLRAAANGVPTPVNLSYIDLSNWGPKDATGRADLIFAEGIVRVTAKGLPTLTNQLYQGWLVNSEQGDAISAGRFNADTSGNVVYQGVLPPIANFGFDLFIITVEPEPDDAPQPATDRSIGGYFSLVGQRAADGSLIGGSPGQLPNTGDSTLGTDLLRAGGLLAVMAVSVLVGVRLNRRNA